MLWNRSTIATAVLAIVATCPAWGSDDLERVVDVSFDGEHVTMRDAATGAPIMMPRFLPLHGGRENFALIPEFEFTPHPEGFDLVATYHNDTSQPAHIGDIVLHTFTLGSPITVPDFRYTGEPVRANFASPPAWAHNYPGDLYSPVSIIANEQYAVGISLMYPVMEYKHDVIIGPRTQGGRMADGEGGQGWQIRFSFSDPRNNLRTLQVPALLEPGDTRSYAFAVRVTRDPNEWIRTLQPYHDYFRDTYGEIEYERRSDPVSATVIAVEALRERTNPKGWAKPFDCRPDEFGWEPWTDGILANREFQRFMLWAPSGLYATEQNYPLHFVSPLQDDPKLATAFDPQIGLPRIAAAGNELGLWWGHSARFARQWDPSELEVLDTGDSEHLQYVYRELDAARDAGATVVGLDEFTHRYINIWDGVEWLRALKQRYPELSFVVEPKATDILHHVTPSYYRGFVWPQHADSYDDLTMIHTPHYLADLVNPGHEIWAALRWDRFPHYFGHEASDEKVMSDIEKAARLGFVPLVHADVEFDQTPHAAASWEWSIPSEMRGGDDYDGSGVQDLPVGIVDPIEDPVSDPGGEDGDDVAQAPRTDPRLVVTRVRGENEPKKFGDPRFVTSSREDAAEEKERSDHRSRIRSARPRIVTSFTYRYYDEDETDDSGSDDGAGDGNDEDTVEVFEGGGGDDEGDSSEGDESDK